ncbi:LysR family transcriptional regulator [Acetobacteraceae bacterium H6797]|nr:LysR family transcriptional regulator [Acetobacteraceae bacterium H6797]
MATRTPRIHAPALLYFDAVRRAGSIREAARRLNIASSAVNRQILKLEEEVGVPLFDRLTGGLKLTAAGEVIAHHVTTVIRDLERASSVLDALQGLETGHVEVATLEGLCHRVLPSALAEVRARHARLSIGIGIMETSRIPAAIIEGDVHLGLAFEVRRQPELRQIAMVRLKLGAVMLPGSALARRPFATLRDCLDQPLILPKMNFANRDQLHPLFFQSKLRERGQYEAGSIEMMRQLVLSGAGTAFMTRAGLETALERGELVHVPLHHQGRPVHSELGLYARADTALPVAAEAVATEIGKAMAACATADKGG